MAGCWAVMGVSTGSCYGHSEHGRRPRKRWKEPGKVPGEEAMEAESSRGFPEHQVGEAAPSTGRIMSKRTGRVTECAHMCTCVYLCGYVHTHVRDGLCSHGLSMYTMPATVGHGQQTCACAE